MKIASRATPEGLAGHGLSTTGIHVLDTKIQQYTCKKAATPGAGLKDKDSFCGASRTSI